jgi:hypothetical protein
MGRGKRPKRNRRMLAGSRPVDMIPRRFGSRSMRLTQAYEVSASLPSLAGQGFYLSFDPTANLPNWTSNFTNTFEVFRTISARVCWTPAFTENVYSASYLANVPMYSALSPTVSTVPTSSGQLLQYQSVLRHQLMRGWTRRAAPCVVGQLFPSTAFDYQPSQEIWSSVGNAPQTNGLLVYVDATGNTATLFVGTFTVYITFDVAVPF